MVSERQDEVDEEWDKLDEEWDKEFDPKPTNKEKSKTKKVVPISKYSFNGKGVLHEAVIISGKPYFIKFTNGKIELVEQVEENTRILRPPEKEEYAYKTYEFESIEEVQEII